MGSAAEVGTARGQGKRDAGRCGGPAGPSCAMTDRRDDQGRDPHQGREPHASAAPRVPDRRGRYLEVEGIGARAHSTEQQPDQDRHPGDRRQGLHDPERAVLRLVAHPEIDEPRAAEPAQDVEQEQPPLRDPPAAMPRLGLVRRAPRMAGEEVQRQQVGAGPGTPRARQQLRPAGGRSAAAGVPPGRRRPPGHATGRRRQGRPPGERAASGRPARPRPRRRPPLPRPACRARLQRRDPADADHRHVHGLGNLVDDTQRHRPQGRTTHAAVPGARAPPASGRQPVPGSVLMAEIASAPASSQARATARTSDAAAVSLAISGRSQARRTAATADAADDASSPKATPREPLAHDRLSSTPAIPGTPSSRRAPSASSLADSPHRLRMTCTLQPAHDAEYRSRTWSSPRFCSPTPSSSPAGTSAVRGAGCPPRALRLVPRVTMAPRRSRSTRSAISAPYPNGPAATITGLASTSPRPRSTSRLTGRPPMASSAGPPDTPDTPEPEPATPGPIRAWWWARLRRARWKRVARPVALPGSRVSPA